MNTTSLPPLLTTTLPPEVVHVQTLRAVYIWVLVAVGLPGNLACLATVLSMHMTTATFYVALLALTDSVALVTRLIFHQLIAHRKMSLTACSTYSLTGFLGCYANWVLVLICFERFFAVCFPLKKHVYFTKTKVYISAGVLAVLVTACFFPKLFFYEGVRNGKDCIRRKSMSGYYKNVWNAGFLESIYFFIPFLLVTLFTLLVIVGLHRHRRTLQMMQMSANASANTRNASNAERAISIMLVAASLIFLVLHLPACLYHLHFKYLYNSKIVRERIQKFVFFMVVTVLVDANHAVNFFIYFVSAAKFRACFVQLLHRCPCFRKSANGCSVSDDTTHISLTANANRTPENAELSRV